MQPGKADILIIDDKADNLQIISLYLKSKGFEVAIASTGLLGLERAERVRPELILLDINMPGMDGFQVCTKLKTSETLRDIPVIFITALNDTESIEKGFQTGGVDYITKPVRKEELLARVNNHMKISRYKKGLERLVAERTQELQKQNLELKEAKQKAEESDRLKTAFLANMSHEIRTPMNGIMGFAELLQQPNLNKENQNKYLEIIQSSGNRMLRIINDLIDISRIESGEMEIREEPTCLNDVLEEVYTFFQHEAMQKGLELELSCPLPDDKCTGLTDRTKLFQVVNNLVKNAIKFTDKGHVKMAYHLIGEEENKKKKFNILVSDTGAGIGNEFQNKIFDRFWQADRPSFEPAEGIGLGLSISKAFVEKTGGEISLSSTPGKGSDFSFTWFLDSASESTQQTSESPTKKLQPNENTRVLIVEDEEVNYDFLKQVLAGKGIHVVHAWNGLEGVELFRRERFDLILMDIKMPVMDGLQATRIIKSEKPDLPVLVQTAYAFDKDRKLAYDAGADGFITKPTRPDMLLREVELLIANAKA